MEAKCCTAEGASKEQLESLLEARLDEYRFMEVKGISMVFAGMKWHAIVILEPEREMA